MGDEHDAILSLVSWDWKVLAARALAGTVLGSDLDFLCRGDLGVFVGLHCGRLPEVVGLCVFQDAQLGRVREWDRDAEEQECRTTGEERIKARVAEQLKERQLGTWVWRPRKVG